MSLGNRSGVGIFVGVIGATAFLLQGYDQGVMNGLLTLPTFEHQFPSINTSVNKSEDRSVLQGTTVAIYEVGCAIGALSCFIIGDILGRRRTIFLAACIIIIGTILQATPFSLAQLIVARIITGLGVGAFTATVPMWVTECSKAHDRGKMVMLEGCFAIGGVALASWLDFGFYFLKDNDVNWRFPIAFQSVFAIIVLSLIMFMPGSFHSSDLYPILTVYRITSLAGQERELPGRNRSPRPSGWNTSRFRCSSRRSRDHS